MKKYLIWTAFLGLTGCRLVETASLPVQYHLIVHAEQNLKYSVYQMKKPGEWSLLASEKTGRYWLDIPMMGGGYKQFLFIKYSIHDPKTYPVVEIRSPNRKPLELSIQKIEKLNQDSEKNRILVLE